MKKTTLSYYSTVVNGAVKTPYSKSFLCFEIYNSIETLMKQFRKENKKSEYFSEEFQRFLLGSHLSLIAPIITDIEFSKKIQKEFEHLFTANDLNLL